MPGLVDESAGTAVWSANLGWRDLPLRDLLQARLTHLSPASDSRAQTGRLAVALGHDVRAGLLAEHRLGAARGCDDAIFVPLGTGIAAALLEARPQ